MAKAQTRSGVLLIDKPAGVTSHDVVEQVRKRPGWRGTKVGHAGTLDPFATGLLVVLVGKATRLQRYLVGLPKSYTTTARFGAESSTLDRDGVVSTTGATTDLKSVNAALVPLRGTIEQRVPMTSAVKVGGERLYRKARRGEEIETPTRTVEIGRLELLSFEPSTQEGVLDLDCSSGTYVRQLVSDLGEACGCGAYCTELRRTAVGPWRVEDADEQRLLSLSDSLPFLPERPLTEPEALQVVNGVAIESGMELNGRPVRMTRSGELIAVGEARGTMLKPATVVGGL